jgi:hypothetical protein
VANPFLQVRPSALISDGWHQRGVLGALLRRIDRHMPSTDGPLWLAERGRAIRRHYLHVRPFFVCSCASDQRPVSLSVASVAASSAGGEGVATRGSDLIGGLARLVKQPVDGQVTGQLGDLILGFSPGDKAGYVR